MDEFDALYAKLASRITGGHPERMAPCERLMELTALMLLRPIQMADDDTPVCELCGIQHVGLHQDMLVPEEFAEAMELTREVTRLIEEVLAERGAAEAGQIMGMLVHSLRAVMSVLSVSMAPEDVQEIAQMLHFGGRMSN